MKRAIVILAIIAICLTQAVSLTSCNPIEGGLFLGLMMASGNSEEFMETSVSPDGSYTLDAYRTSGGATTDFGIRVYQHALFGKKEIYYQYHKDRVEINWESNSIVNINGVKLDLSKGETYKRFNYTY